MPKADQNSINDFNSFKQAFINETVRRVAEHPDLLKYVLVQTPEICLAAVEENGLALQYVDKPTADICNAAVKQTAEAMKFVPDEFLASARAFIMTSEDRERQAVKERTEGYLARIRGGMGLQFVPEDARTPEICLAAVQEFGFALELVKDQTPEICLAAVKNDERVLHLVKEQTPEICLAAVQKNGHALEYVREQTPEICMAAVQQNGLALTSVRKQTPEICVAAIKQNVDAMEYVKKDLRDQVKAALAKENIDVREPYAPNYGKYLEMVRRNGMQLRNVPEDAQTPEICLAAMQSSCFAFRFVRNQTPEICLAAVEKNGMLLKDVKEQTPEICLAAVKQDREAMEFVKEDLRDQVRAALEKENKPDIVAQENPKSEGDAVVAYPTIEEIKEEEIRYDKALEGYLTGDISALEAVREDWRILKHIRLDEETPDVCMAAVKQNGNALKFVDNQTPEICMAAVKQDGNALRFVEEQTPEICIAAIKQNGKAMEFVEDYVRDKVQAALARENKPKHSGPRM